VVFARDTGLAQVIGWPSGHYRKEEEPEALEASEIRYRSMIEKS